MKEKSGGALMVIFLLLCFSSCLAQSKPIESAARRQIELMPMIERYDVVLVEDREGLIRWQESVLEEDDPMAV
jgi:hypothetical protein